MCTWSPSIKPAILFTEAMGRKKRKAEDYAVDHDDLQEISGGLFCKYCRMEINLVSKPSERIREHLGSKRHDRLKRKYMRTSGNQPTLEQTLVTARRNKEETVDVCHEFVKAVCYSGLPFAVMEGPVADLVKQFCPAARSMPGVDSLAGPYLDRVFHHHTEQIKMKIGDQPVTVIVDESPELLGRPCLNTLFAFYDVEKGDRRVLLVDCSFLNVCNAASILLHLTDVLRKYNLDWSRVIGLASDSAAYMRALFADLKRSHNPRMVHIACPAHLINVAVSTALESPDFTRLQKVATHMGSLFKHACNVRRLYIELCSSAGCDRAKIPPTVVPTRWFSWYESAEVVLQMWPQLLALVDHSNSGAKARKQAERLGNHVNRQHLFFLLKFVVSLLQQVHSIQKVVEGEGVLIHRIDHLLSVQLPAIFTSIPNTAADLSSELQSLLCMLDPSDVSRCLESCQSFYTVFSAKWTATTDRNLSLEIKSLWKRCTLLDPFRKRLFHSTFDNYVDMFMLVLGTNLPEELCHEFKQYLTEPLPSNEEVEVMDYWRSVAPQYPNLSTAALRLLSMPISSASVERSFSKLRGLQVPTRANLSAEKLCMQAVLHHNQGL